MLVAAIDPNWAALIAPPNVPPPLVRSRNVTKPPPSAVGATDSSSIPGSAPDPLIAAATVSGPHVAPPSLDVRTCTVTVAVPPSSSDHVAASAPETGSAAISGLRASCDVSWNGGPTVVPLAVTRRADNALGSRPVSPSRTTPFGPPAIRVL